MLVRICPKCRLHHNPDANFCNTCGTSLAGQPLIESNPAPQIGVSQQIDRVEKDGIAIGSLVAQAGAEVNIGQHERLFGAEGSGPPSSKAGRYVARGPIEDELWQALQACQKRAVVGVGGMGGVGKTELALHLAQRANQAQPDRVLWVAIGDRSLWQVQYEMARALGIKLDPNADDHGRGGDIRRALEQKPRLVVLDDVRKDFAPWLSFCLPPCPPCAVLITSRLHELPGLEHGELRPLDVMDEAQSLELLGATPELAQQLQKEAQAARDLAKKCSYHPLALDLAVPQLLRRLQDSDTPLADYVQSMTSRLKQLKDLSDVQRSLQASFDLSYQALEDHARRRFYWLAAFAESGFRTTAAAALWQLEESEARDALDDLWNASLAQRGGRKGWWKLHDLLYEYAALQLIQSNEEAAVRQALAEWMVDLFDRFYVDDPSTAPEVTFELENLTSAIKWALAQKDGELLARLVTKPRNWLLNVYRQLDTWMDWLNAALSLGIKNRHLKANVLQAIGDVQQFRDERDAALESYRQALELFRAVGARLGEANTLKAIGQAYLTAGDQQKYAEGAQLLQSALDIYRQIGALSGQANTLFLWARWLASMGQPAEALPFAQEAYDLGQRFAPGHPVTEYFGQFVAALQSAAQQPSANPGS
jgi:tetratricopeptide (TPR) repeat protein